MSRDRSANRIMFWRIIRRLLGANRGRLFVILLALGAGACVSAALLNLQVDAQRRLTTEFRAFGPNVVIAPKDSALPGSDTLNESTISSIPMGAGHSRVIASSSLYLVASVSSPQSKKSLSAGVAAYSPLLVSTVAPHSAMPLAGDASALSHEPLCVLGTKVAQQLDLQPQAQLVLTDANRRETCRVSGIIQTGGPEDNRVELDLRTAQRLANLPGRISMIELTVPGTVNEIQAYFANLQSLFPDAEVRPLRQFTEAEAKIYNRINGILTATVALVLILTALCVMAAMTNVAMERRNDVGLMKAIGGATRRVLRLFLAEAAVLGLAGGVIGATAGILLSIWLGKAVFGVAARPRLIVYPVAVILTMVVAIAGAYPLRRLATIRPASVFRGEA